MLLDALLRSLNFLALPLWTTAQERIVESFVLQALDVIPRTGGIRADTAPGEAYVVSFIETRMEQQHYEPAFYAAVIRKWRSVAVSSVLRARGVLQTGIDDVKRDRAEFKARQRADIAWHGLRDCTLSSCSKTK